MQRVQAAAPLVDPSPDVGRSLARPSARTDDMERYRHFR